MNIVQPCDEGNSEWLCYVPRVTALCHVLMHVAVDAAFVYAVCAGELGVTVTDVS